MANQERLKRLFDSNVAQYIIGYLMADPQVLFKNNILLTVNDFPKPIYQTIFGAINNLAASGTTRIFPDDVDVYLGQYNDQYRIFNEGNGLEFLRTIEQSNVGRDESQFNLYYDKLKKFTILRDLEKINIDTTEFYNFDNNILSGEDPNEKLDRISIQQILDQVRLKLVKIEKDNINKDGNYCQDISDGIDELIDRLHKEPDVGYPLEGDILNFTCRGGRQGKMYLYSAGSGGGKTRFFVDQACYRAFPRLINGKIEQPTEELQKVYYVSVEQEPEEIQKIVLACLSGVNQEKINNMKLLSPEEESCVMTAVQIMKTYKGNFIVDRIPEPSILKVRSTIIEKIMDKEVSMVVYDYLAVPEDDDGSLSRRQLRVDQMLMQFSNMLKEVAVSYNVFMLTGTQITGGDVTKHMARGFADIRDAKSIADKADFAMIACRVEDEEFSHIETFCNELGLERPNMVLDIYKNRDGRLTNCKIYRNFDLGTMRGKDLLITTQNFKIINDYGTISYGSKKIVDVLDFLTRGDKNENI